MSTVKLYCGDCLDVLRRLPDQSVQCVVTSPPYWGLRDYGVSGQLGLEPTPEEYVSRMVAVFAEVRRVLRDDGTCWVNLGDSYAATSTGGASDKSLLHGGRGVGPNEKIKQGPAIVRLAPPGLKPKDLVGIPWRVAFGLQADGWYLRSDIIWHKPNPMPESVRDRPTKSHEYLFLLTKSSRYCFDAEAVREQASRGPHTRNRLSCFKKQGKVGRHHQGNPVISLDGNRNLRSVWTIPTQRYKGAHFATFPRRLVSPCIKAGTKPGDTVLDPFAGSGTTGAEAVTLGRDFIGIDLSADYLRLARQRIADARKAQRQQEQAPATNPKPRKRAMA